MIKETFEESNEEEEEEENVEYIQSLSRLDQEMGSVLKNSEVRS